MRHMLSILLENESGALSRVIGLFSQRGYNIETITVAPTEDPSVSKMTVQTVGDEQTIEQVEKQLHKLIDVLRVIHMKSSSFIEREIILIKVQVNNATKHEIKNIVEIFKGKIIDITPTIYILQLSGATKKIDSFINIIRSTSEIIEITRSGIIGISRESQLSNETVKKLKII